MKKVILATAAFLAAGIGSANAGVSIVQSPTDFFAPGQAATLFKPYFREFDEDWGYTHGGLADQDTSASGVAVLRISAYDVDFNGNNGNGPERDAIYAGTDATGIFLGYLQGSNNVYAFTDFVLDSPAELALVQSGLPIFMDIDVGTGNGPGLWSVTLGRSVLCSNVRDPAQCAANPNPGRIPEPITLTLFAVGLAGAAAMRRRKQKAAL